MFTYLGEPTRNNGATSNYTNLIGSPVDIVDQPIETPKFDNATIENTDYVSGKTSG